MTYVTPGVKGNTIDAGAQVDADRLREWANSVTGDTDGPVGSSASA
jgi:hypothetical protein